MENITDQLAEALKNIIELAKCGFYYNYPRTENEGYNEAKNKIDFCNQALKDYEANKGKSESSKQELESEFFKIIIQTDCSLGDAASQCAEIAFNLLEETKINAAGKYLDLEMEMREKDQRILELNESLLDVTRTLNTKIQEQSSQIERMRRIFSQAYHVLVLNETSQANDLLFSILKADINKILSETEPNK